MSPFQQDYYSVVRGRQSRERYSSRLFTHSPVRTERCLSLSPSREIFALDRGRSLLPTRDEDRIRSLSLNDLHSCGDPKCILPFELHDAPEFRLYRKSRKLVPASKSPRGRVPLYESTEPQSRGLNRLPVSAPSLSVVYGREGRLSSYEPLESRVRLPSYERKRRLSRSPSAVRDSTGYTLRADRKKFQHVKLHPSSSSPTRYRTVSRSVNRAGRDSPDICTYERSESPHRDSPSVIPRGGSSITARLGRSSPRDVEITSRLPSKKPITRITMVSPTSTGRPVRPALQEVKNEETFMKKVRFIDDKSRSSRRKSESTAAASDLPSTSLVVRKKKAPGTSSLSTTAQPPSVVRARTVSKTGGSTLPGDPVLRRRRTK